MTAFFCVKLFEICTTGMAMLSYFSSTQELRRWIAAQVELINIIDRIALHSIIAVMIL